MKRWYAFVAVLAVVLRIGGGPALAKEGACGNAGAGADDVIEGCTLLIDQKRGTVTDQEHAYINRGNAWLRKGNADKAIADYTQAISLDPNDSLAAANRGNAWLDKGYADKAIADYDQAILLEPRDGYNYNGRGAAWLAKGRLDKAFADYDQAVGLYPADAISLFNRGRVHFYRQEFSLAKVDFDSVMNLQPRDPYGALWRELAARRTGSQGALAADAANLDLARWPGPIVKLFLEQLTPEQVVLSESQPDRIPRSMEDCEYNFYAGELALARKSARDARPLLQRAAQDCAATSVEAISAKLALGGVGAAAEAFPQLMGASDTTVCKAALNADMVTLNHGAADAVAEAAARHLSIGDCRVALGLPRATFPVEVVKNARDLLAAAQQFGASGISADDVIRLAPLVLALNKAMAGESEADVVSSTKTLRDKLAATPAYASFVAATAAEKEKQAAHEIAEQQGALAIVRAFTTDYVARNMLSDKVPTLLSLLADIDAATASKDPARMTAQVQAARNSLQTASIADAYNRFVAQRCGAESLPGCSQDLALGVPTQPPPPQEPSTVPPAASADAGSRIALVIGNSAYQNANQLPNPRNDARAIAAKLKGLGFQVIEGEDLDKQAMDRTVQQFEDGVVSAKVALLFYAGHGMQYQGHNYLIPIDARLETASSVNFETVGVDQILATMSDPGRVGIAMLDSCRDNPLARKFSRNLPRAFLVGNGMAMTGTDAGSLLIAFATAPDQTASDGDGEHSPFTQALLDNMAAKSTEIGLMLKRVRQEVIHLTNNEQQPWESSSIGEFYLNP